MYTKCVNDFLATNFQIKSNRNVNSSHKTRWSFLYTQAAFLRQMARLKNVLQKVKICSIDILCMNTKWWCWKDVWINNDEECEGCSRWCKNNQWVVSMDCYLYTVSLLIMKKLLPL